MRLALTLTSFSLLALAACEIYPPTVTPDYTIRVMPSEKGMVAIPPNCPSWAFDNTNPYDSQPIPQFGCANARNLALMVEQPQDLVKGREMGRASGTTTVGAMRRYNNNQTRGLLDLSGSPDTAAAATTAPASASPMTGEVTSSGAGSGTK